MDISGEWIFTQKWNGQPTYRFEADLKEGQIIIPTVPNFHGTWIEIESKGKPTALVLAIGDKTLLVAYGGHTFGKNMMGGEMRAIMLDSSKTIPGTWSAIKKSYLDREIQEFILPPIE